MTAYQLDYRDDLLVIQFRREGHRIDARTLAAALNALADAASAANLVSNPGYSVELEVIALESGSFVVRLTPLYQALGNLFSGEIPKGVIAGVIATYLCRQVWPEQPVQVNIQEGLVVVEDPAGTRITVRTDHPVEITKAESSQPLVDAIGAFIYAVATDESISAITIGDSSPEPQGPTIPRSAFQAVALPPREEEQEFASTVPARVQIVRAILERSRRRWEFGWEGHRISAPVLDDQFYDRFASHDFTIGPGDALQVDLRIYQHRDPHSGVVVNRRYEVIRVHEFIPRSGKDGSQPRPFVLRG